jgi:hypothetical protein
MFIADDMSLFRSWTLWRIFFKGRTRRAPDKEKERHHLFEFKGATWKFWFAEPPPPKHGRPFSATATPVPKRDAGAARTFGLGAAT